MINWQEVPFIRLFIPFLCGLISAAYGFLHQVDTSIFIVLLLILLLFFSWISSHSISYRFRKVSGSILILLLSLFGHVVWQVQTPGYEQQHYTHIEADEATFLFRINDQKLSHSGKSQQLKVTILGIEAQPGVLKRAKGESFCYLPADIKLKIGDCILAHGLLDTIAPPAHPGSFDFANYMALQGMVRQLRLKAPTIYILPDDPFPSLRGILRKTRSHLQEKLTQALPASAAGLVVALVLGQKNQLDASIREDYTQVGAMHVLAVSGMHVGIIAMGLSYLLNFWTGGSTYIRLSKGIIAVCGIWLFTLLTGGAPSVLRAATMFSLFTLAKELYLNQNIWNILSATALLMLCAQSRALFTVGFQLSFLAVAAIVYFQPKLAGLLPLKNKLADYFWQLFCLGIAAQLGTAILSIHYFHQFPIYFWLSGLIIVPLATIALLLGVAVLAFTEVPQLGNFLAALLQKLVWIMNESMAWISELPGSTLQGLQISTILCLSLIGLFLLSILWFEYRSKYLVYIIFGITLFLGPHLFKQQNQQQQQNQLLVYHYKKGLAFSLVEGRKAFSFYDQKSPPPQLDYAKSSFFQARNIQQDSIINLGATSGLIHWDDTQILILQNQVDWCQIPLDDEIEVAILGPKFRVSDLHFIKGLEIKTYYLHPGLSRKNRQLFKNQLPLSAQIIDGYANASGLYIDFKS